MYIYMYILTYVRMCIYVYKCFCMYMYVYVCICMYIYVYVCMYACMYMYVYVRIHVRIYVYVCMHPYVYVCIYIHILRASSALRNIEAEALDPVLPRWLHLCRGLTALFRVEGPGLRGLGMGGLGFRVLENRRARFRRGCLGACI